MRIIARLTILGLSAVLLFFLPAPSQAQVAVGISVQFGPPALPVYEQPICPGDGYVWTPGYWAYSEDDGYYWVPGTWVLAPVGLLWTPGYWGWQNNVYAWYPGYWGPEVGYYGGIDYGFGYVGTGYEGGYWDHDHFYYNRAVNHVENVRNVYNKTVINNVTVNNVSYNGGPGGTTTRPTPAQEAVARAHHTPPTAAQVQHEHEASTDRSQFASVNRGKPGVAATVRPAEFKVKGVVSAKAAAPYNPPPRKANKPEEPKRPANPPAASRPEPSNPRQPEARPENPSKAENPKTEMKQQQEIQKQQEKQDQEQQKAQEQRQKEIQKQQQQNNENERRQQNMERQRQPQMRQPEQQRPQEQPKAEPRPQPRPEARPEPKSEEKPQPQEKKEER